MKWVLRIVGVLAVLVLVVGVVAWFSLNAIVKSTVETAGESATGVETRLAAVDLSPFAGAVDLGGFELRQPEGFSGLNILELREGDVQVEVGSVLSETIRVPKLHLDGVHVTVAFENGKLNISELQKQIEANIGGAEGEEDSAPSEDEVAEQKIVIDSLRITNTTVTGSIALLPGQEPLSIDLKIADIEQQNIGSDGSGLTVTDAVALLVDTVLVNVARDLGDVVPNLGAVVGDLGTGAGEVVNALGSQAGDVVDGAGEAVDGALGDVADTLGGLFGGNRNDESKE